MQDTNSLDLVSVGVFSPPDAERLLESLVAQGVKPEIEVDYGIRNVSVRFGSGGMMARVEVFVPLDAEAQACSIRDKELKLNGEV
jgi:hypothetical protein